MVKTYDKFSILQEYPDNLFRWCSEEEVISLLTNGELIPRNYEFISLSASAVNGFYADYCLIFDKKELLKQGIEKVRYTKKFFSDNPKIFKHVNRTIKNNKQQFVVNGIKNVDSLIKQCKKEAEYIIPKIRLSNGVLVSILKNMGYGMSHKIDEQNSQQIFKILTNLIK